MLGMLLVSAFGVAFCTLCWVMLDGAEKAKDRSKNESV